MAAPRPVAPVITGSVPLASAADAAPALAVHGPLAAAMERLVELAASALRTPFAFIILTGDDRRCFGAGPGLPSWATHDAGAFWRSGIVDLISAAPVEMRDLTRDLSADQLAAAAELGIGSLLGVPIRAATGQSIGVFCAADPQPTQWNEDDMDMLERFAGTAASDYELRHSLAEHEANERQRGVDSTHDPLTGLANRAVLVDRLRFALARASARPVAPIVDDDTTSSIEAPPDDLVAVFFLDVNDFRGINERFGHHVGDQLLASLGKRLSQVAGPHATVARLGGDEFAVLLERVDAADVAEDLAEQFRVALSAPTTIGGEDVSLSVSVGIALSTTAAELPEHVLRGADLAMARAKRAGRSQVPPKPVLFDWKIAAEARAKRRLQDELRKAVTNDEFVLHYMPIISLETVQISGAEALLRWNHPTRGLLSPFEFLSVVEELDIVSEVGRWVLREACHQVREWNQELPTESALSIAVNLSARQFNATGFLDDVARTIKIFGMPPELLVLEVNERVVAQDLTRAAGVLTGLRALGVKIHLDDFGSGNSPLGYLQRLPLDGVKIDHILVNRMDRDDRALRVVRSVVGLAREFGLDVVAEGISSAGHLKVLQEIGCTHGQGQLFSSAVEASGVTGMLRDRPW
ncbi:MAG TPA: GGDEF domain-containing protein [Gemmatimonadaceae bacterium]